MVVGLGAVIFIASIVFRSFTGATGGAGSPEAAVRNLADAIGREDAPGALTLLPPGEVRSAKGVFDKATSKASKAGILRAANPFGGIDLRIADLRLDVQELSKDVARVTVRGGDLALTIDEKAAQTPVQSVLAQARDESDQGDAWGKRTINLGPTNDHPAVTLMTVRQRGRWYVSPVYSILENWRQEEGLPNADFGLDLSKISNGSKTPEGAVNDLASAVQAFDMGRVIDALSPDELGGPFRRYRQAILAGTADWVSELRSEASFRVNDSRLVVQGKKGSTADVAIPSASGTASGDGSSARWALTGTCVNVVSSSDRSNSCLAEADPESLLAVLGRATDNYFVSVTSRRGRWYVSPVQTALRYAEILAEKLDERQVLGLLDMRQFAKPDGAVTNAGPVQGSLAAGQYGVYTYDVAAPGPILTCTNAGGRDSYVDATLYRPNGREAEYVEGGIYMAGEGGAHRVVLRSYASNRSGDFDVAVKPVPVQDVGLPGEASGAIGPRCDGKMLRFTAAAGDKVLIQGKLPHSTPTVYNAKGEYYSSGRLFTARQAGTYLLALTDPGDYAVRLEKVTGTFIGANESAQGTVTANGTAAYQFYASGGERLRFFARGTGSFDGQMELLSPTGVVLASADDTSGRDPAISWSFSTEGVYRVRVSGYQGQAGSFTLSVS